MFWRIFFLVILTLFPILISILAHCIKPHRCGGRLEYFIFLMLLFGGAFAIVFGLIFFYDHILNRERPEGFWGWMTFTSGAISFITAIHYCSMLFLHFKNRHDICLLCRHDNLSNSVAGEALNVFFSDKGLSFMRTYQKDDEVMKRFYEKVKSNYSKDSEIEAAIQVAKEDDEKHKATYGSGHI